MEVLVLIFLSVVLQAGALLKHRDGESVHVEVDWELEGESEEGLRKWACVLVTEAVVKLRVGVLGIIVLNADGGPGEVLQVVFELYEELTIILVDKSDLLFESGCPEL